MKILLAMDTSSASQVALDEVAERPWPAGSSVQVLSVVEPSHLWTTSEAAEQAPRLATEIADVAVERLRASGLEAAGDVSGGDPKTVILDRAGIADVDFIMVGSHGVSAIAKFLLGNVASAVLRYAPCSVEVVRARAPRTARSSPMKILLATDGSDSSDQAAHSIAERPWPAGTEVRVLNVVELTLPTSRALLEPPFVDAALMASLREDAMKKSQAAVASATEILLAAGLEAADSISVLLTGPKALILDEANQWGAGLIVLGSHGRRGMDRFLLGSVSEAVALHASCSVEVIRKRIPASV
jgi:nucleotide-binding universal stress UspA family protein